MDLLWTMSRAKILWWRLVTGFVYRPTFGSIGKGSVIIHPILVRNSKAISIGAGCGIRDHARIEVLSQSPDGQPKLTVGDGTTMEQGVHIVCQGKISIGKNVTIAPRVTILDTNHPYDDVELESSIGSRLGSAGSEIFIDDLAFLGAGTVVLPNVRIGKYCIVGANSVVSKSLPDYSVCAGSPAKVIKKYDFEQKKWIKAS